MLPQLNACLAEHLRRQVVHPIRLGVHHLANPHLYNLDRTAEARASVAVDRALFPNSLPSSLQQRVLLSMHAQTPVQSLATRCRLVASIATSFVAVGQVLGRAIVPGRNHPFLSNKDTANASLHAIGPTCRQIGKIHKVRVPGGSKQVWVGNVQSKKRRL